LIWFGAAGKQKYQGEGEKTLSSVVVHSNHCNFECRSVI